jgi:class 3 adenylate cyclase
MRRH